VWCCSVTTRPALHGCAGVCSVESAHCSTVDTAVSDAGIHGDDVNVVDDSSFCPTARVSPATVRTATWPGWMTPKRHRSPPAPGPHPCTPAAPPTRSPQTPRRPPWQQRPWRLRRLQRLQRRRWLLPVAARGLRRCHPCSCMPRWVEWVDLADLSQGQACCWRWVGGHRSNSLYLCDRGVV
jgi:hypothetical protein